MNAFWLLAWFDKEDDTAMVPKSIKDLNSFTIYLQTREEVAQIKIITNFQKVQDNCKKLFQNLLNTSNGLKMVHLYENIECLSSKLLPWKSYGGLGSHVCLKVNEFKCTMIIESLALLCNSEQQCKGKV